MAAMYAYTYVQPIERIYHVPIRSSSRRITYVEARRIRNRKAAKLCSQQRNLYSSLSFLFPAIYAFFEGSFFEKHAFIDFRVFSSSPRVRWSHYTPAYLRIYTYSYIPYTFTSKLNSVTRFANKNKISLTSFL